jgi:Protein of unknown function (DUF4231)
MAKWKPHLLADAVFAKEDTELVTLIRDKVKKLQAPPPEAVRKAWVENVLRKELWVLRREARWWQAVAFSAALAVAVLGLFSAVGGALGKGVASGNFWSIVAVAAGSLVTAITAFMHTRQPDVERDAVQRTRKHMRREGWNYLQGLGAYKGGVGDAADYDLFVERISDLLDRLLSAGRGGSVAAPPAGQASTARKQHRLRKLGVS